MQHPFAGIIVPEPSDTHVPQMANEASLYREYGRRSFVAAVLGMLSGTAALLWGGKSRAQEPYAGPPLPENPTTPKPDIESRPVSQATPNQSQSQVTTRALGEEGGDTQVTTYALGEEGGQGGVTTYALGEEGSGGPPSTPPPATPPTTYALGEEGSPGRPTTYALGEEGGPGRPTTYALGEEGTGGPVTTYALGEEGSGRRATTLALGEEGAGRRRYRRWR